MPQHRVRLLAPRQDTLSHATRPSAGTTLLNSPLVQQVLLLENSYRFALLANNLFLAARIARELSYATALLSLATLEALAG